MSFLSHLTRDLLKYKKKLQRNNFVLLWKWKLEKNVVFGFLRSSSRKGTSQILSPLKTIKEFVYCFPLSAEKTAEIFLSSFHTSSNACNTRRRRIAYFIRKWLFSPSLKIFETNKQTNVCWWWWASTIWCWVWKLGKEASYTSAVNFTHILRTAFFCQFPCAKKVQTFNVSTEKLLARLLYKKVACKMLV